MNEDCKPRLITTLEELDALPDGAVIRDSDATFAKVYECHGHWGEPYGTYFYGTGHEHYTLSGDIALPATVLYEPEPAA